MRIVSLLILAASYGASLALVSIWTGLATGWIGAGMVIVCAFLARRKWALEHESTGLEPGAPERCLRFNATALALLLGHVSTGLIYPDIDLHVGSGNNLAIDNWSMILGVGVAGWLFRGDRKTKDERDAIISATGTQAGYLALTIVLVAVSLTLAFSPPHLLASLSHFKLGNILIAITLFSILTKYTSQLIGYAADTVRSDVG